MTKYEKVLNKIIKGKSDTNIPFSDLYNLLISLKFEVRIKGSHHMFRKEGIKDRINLQKDGNKAKPYQIKQVRNIILKYRLEEK